MLITTNKKRANTKHKYITFTLDTSISSLRQKCAQ